MNLASLAGHSLKEVSCCDSISPVGPKKILSAVFKNRETDFFGIEFLLIPYLISKTSSPEADWAVLILLWFEDLLNSLGLVGKVI